jgi:hypothetical protein
MSKVFLSDLTMQWDMLKNTVTEILVHYTMHSPHGEVLFKIDIKLFFPIFFEELLHAATWLKLPKG